MKIQRLYIGDFGILRNQVLDEIHPGIVVIGGHNRAGKSTFMQVLRYLGYGFPQGRDLPPASSIYEAEADVKLDIGDIYNIKLRGYGQPILKRISGTDRKLVDVGELYGIDDFTYGQLFTIALDQLSGNYNMPRDDKRRLKSILLGAGFSDMILIPQLEQDFYREADRIGGKRGNPGVKQFKPYYNDIEKGQRLKEKGLSQVELYQQNQRELKERERDIELINREIEGLNYEVMQLDVIKNNFDSYSELENLEAELEYKRDYVWEDSPLEYELERLKSLRDEYIDLNKELEEKEIELGLDSQVRDLLLNKEEEIAHYRAGISGIGERRRQWIQRKHEYEKKRQDLILRIRNANGAWDESQIDLIASINTDNIEQNILSEMVENCKQLSSQLKSRRDNLNRMREELKMFQDQEIKEDRPWVGVKRYFYFSLGFLILGIILSFINPLSGILLGIGGMIGTAVYLIMKAWDSKGHRNLVKTQKIQLDGLKAKIYAEEKAIEDIESELFLLEEELHKKKGEMGLSSEVSYSILPGHIIRIKDIQDRIEELNAISKTIEDDGVYLQEQYERYVNFVGQFSKGYRDQGQIDDGKIEGAQGYNEEDWNGVALGLELWSNNYNKAQEIHILEQKLAVVRKTIIGYMGKYGYAVLPNNEERSYEGFDRELAQFIHKSERAIEFKRIQARLRDTTQSILNSMGSDAIRRAFGFCNAHDSVQEDELINAFRERCSLYGSRQEAEEDYYRVLRDRNSKEDELESLKDNRRKLENQLQELAATENLAQGQRQIHNARSQLRGLAKEYAINMTAAFLLREAGNNLLEGMKDSIMGSAGNIFNRMTRGYYKGILPAEPLLEADFQAILRDSTDPQTIDMLSRGTKEQLYLSVRLSRIMEIKPSLPIIIDDSFANFDSMHLAQSIGILSELSSTHQIFILTCHGELVEEISKSHCKAQYWELDRGTLRLSSGKELSDYLLG